VHFDKQAAEELAWEMVMGNQEDDPNDQQEAMMVVIVEAIRRYCEECIHI